VVKFNRRKEPEMKRYLGFCILAGLLTATPAKAQINAATFTCQQAAIKAVAKFEGKVASAIEKCLLEVVRCNRQIGPAMDECLGSLLVLDKGKCARGKLGPTLSLYFGPSQVAFLVENPDGSAIGKAVVAFAKGLSKCAPGLGVDYAALGFPNTSPTDVYEVADSLNGNPDGAACLAHKRVLRTIPTRDALMNQLGNHPDGGNLPAGVFDAFLADSLCK
jgi:hypothetical protein